MAWREKMRANVAPLLVSGEDVQALITARSLNMAGSVGALFANPMRLIIATDRRILLCRPARLGNSVREVLHEFPRNIKLGPTHGLSYRTDALGTALEIGHGAYKDVQAADAQLQMPDS
jgi:hypothetical protein